MKENIRSYCIQIYNWLLLFPKLSVFLKGGKHYKGINPIAYFDETKLSPNMRFIIETSHYDNIYRAGWLEPGRDIPLMLSETLSGHVLGMLMIIRVLRAGYRDHFPGVDWEGALNMCTGHEHGEIKNKHGDMTPKDGIDREEKHRLEEEAVDALLLGTPNANYDKKLWIRYENHNDPTACMVHEVDYLQMIIRARIYEKQFGRDLSEFYSKEKFDKRLKSPILRKMFEEIC